MAIIPLNINYITYFSDKPIKISESVPLNVKLEAFGAIMPTQATEQSAGFDLYSIEEGRIFPGERKLINIGISIELPEQTYGQIAPRSSLAIKGIDIGAGIIDADYRGLVKVLVINNSGKNFVYNVYDKIAQLIVIKIENTKIFKVENLTDTERGDNGFGSSGR